MKIVKFSIENYKAIRGRKDFTPNGSSFFLVGGNGVGKTSAGHALIDLLTSKLPSKPITEGENAGYMEFILDDGSKLIAKFTEGKKPLLEFITPQGYGITSPKEIFQKLSGEGMDFSIDDFLKLQPKPLREKLEKIAGLNLSEINDREQKAFDERKLAKAQLADQRGRIQPYEMALVTKPLVSAVDLSNQIQELNRVANEYRAQVALKDQLSTNYEIANKAIQTIAEEGKKRVDQERADLEEYIRKAEAKIAQMEQESAASIQQAVKNANELQDELAAKVAEVNALEAPDEAKITALQSQLEQVEKTNTAIVNAQRLHQEFTVATELEEKVNALEAKVKAIRDEKEKAIKASPIPAEGVTFSEDGDILIDGLPFKENQISTSRQIIAGIQIACSMLGDLKYLHFDGAALDKENADKVLEYAESKGLQLCIERPMWEGGELKFEVYDHSANGVESEVPA